MRTALLSALAGAVFVAPAVGQSNCRYEADRSAMIRASSGDALRLIARAGSLTIRGVDGLEEVRVRGRACASSEELLEELVLETDRSGSTIRVEVPGIDEGGGWFSTANRYAALHLDIEVPKGMAATIEDGSGDARIEGLGALSVVDGSGDLEISDIDGDVDIDDGSGSVRVSDIEGAIRVDDGSGEIDIRDIDGNVEIDDGSGSIDVRNVTGDFVVRDDGSGGIDYANVTGRVDVPRRERRRR
jgi:hypothetical protein